MAVRKDCTSRQEQQVRLILKTKRLATPEERAQVGFIGKRTYVVTDVTGYRLIADTDNGAVGWLDNRNGHKSKPYAKRQEWSLCRFVVDPTDFNAKGKLKVQGIAPHTLIAMLREGHKMIDNTGAYRCMEVNHATNNTADLRYNEITTTVENQVHKQLVYYIAKHYPHCGVWVAAKRNGKDFDRFALLHPIWAEDIELRIELAGGFEAFAAKCAEEIESAYYNQMAEWYL